MHLPSPSTRLLRMCDVLFSYRYRRTQSELERQRRHKRATHAPRSTLQVVTVASLSSSPPAISALPLPFLRRVRPLRSLLLPLRTISVAYPNAYVELTSREVT